MMYDKHDHLIIPPNRSARVLPVLLVVSMSLVSACASGPPSYRQNIQSAIGGRGSVFVETHDDGTVILRGWVEDSYDRQAVLRAARKGGAVTRVINFIQLSPVFWY